MWVHRSSPKDPHNILRKKDVDLETRDLECRGGCTKCVGQGQAAACGRMIQQLERTAIHRLREGCEGFYKTNLHDMQQPANP